MQHRLSSFAAVVGVLGSLAPALLPGFGAAAQLRWTPRTDAPSGEARVAAWQATTGKLALGTDRGIALIAGPGDERFFATRSPVQDARFLEDGRLWVATEERLLLESPAGDLGDITPRAAAGSRIARIAEQRGIAAIATNSGVLLSRDFRAWKRVSVRGDATALSLRASSGASGDFELWWIEDGLLWRAAPGLAPRRVFEFEAGRLVDVVFDLSGTAVALLGEDSLRFREHPEGPWSNVSLDLPAGARAERLFEAAGAFWIASERGLLRSESLAGPWRRATAPVGFAAVSHVVQAGAAVLAAADRVFYQGEVESNSVVLDLPARCEPPIARVYATALEYLDLAPSRFARMRDGVERRGWFPTVSLRLDRDVGRSTTRDWDEVVSSGRLYSLYDRDRDRVHESGASLTLAWDLGDLAFHPESIDVSRETRELLELRDDVLDEIAQHYFERRRTLLEWHAERDFVARERLRLRAAELAARIDAWTGGWFGRATLSPSPPHAGDSPCSGIEFETPPLH